MATSRQVTKYLIFELAVMVLYGYLLTPSEGATVFLLGPKAGLITAISAVFINPVIGIIGLVISGREVRAGSRKALVIILLVLSIGFATLFPVAYAERGISQVFGALLVR